MNKKKQPQTITNTRVKAMAAMMDSDSDPSYGSEGGLKEKPIPVKKRGGLKRKKKTNQPNEDSDGDSQDSSFESDFTEQTDHKTKYIAQSSLKKEKRAGDIEGIGTEYGNRRGREMPEQPKIKMPISLGLGVSDYETDIENLKKNNKQTATANQFNEEKMSERFSEAESTPKINIRPNVQFGMSDAQGTKGALGSTRGREKNNYSPPMIQEYNPFEDNAKTRGEKRKAELKKKREQSMDKDKLRQVPQDPRPWKGKPSDFFILHNPRKGTHKVLNNEQKDFLLIYYPDSVVPPISLMEGLYKQAKDHEDKERQKTQTNDNLVTRGKKGKGKKNRQTTEKRDVYRLVHVNQDSRDFRNRKPVDFQSLLNDEAFQPQVANTELRNLKQQIEKIQQKASDQMRQAELFTSQHYQEKDMSVGKNNQNPMKRPIQQDISVTAPSEQEVIPHGFCPHCHRCGEQPSGGTAKDDTEIQRQQLLRQICAAKQRQAKQEQEEARRLKDEARRLAEQAQLLEMEAQRPLLEAQRLEKEILEMQGQYARLPQRAAATPMQFGLATGNSFMSTNTNHTMLGYAREPAQSQQPSGLASLYQISENRQQSQQNIMGRPMTNYDKYIDDQTFDFMGRREQLLNEARTTQLQIQALRQQATLLQQQSLLPKTRDDKNLDPELRGLYNALENPKPRLIISTNSLAARKAAEERRKEQERREKKEAMEKEKELQYYEKLVKQRQKEAERREREQMELETSNQPKLGRVNINDSRSRSRLRKQFDEQLEKSYENQQSESQDESDDTNREESDQISDSENQIKYQRKYVNKNQPSKIFQPEPIKNNNQQPFKEKTQSSSPKQKQDDSSSDGKGFKPEPAPDPDEVKKLIKNNKSKSRVRFGSGSPERLEDDPAIIAANKEFEKAQKAFEKAQLRQKAALLKKEMEVKQQQADISKAQDEAKQYFEKEKKKKQESLREEQTITIGSRKPYQQQQMQYIPKSVVKEEKPKIKSGPVKNQYQQKQQFQVGWGNSETELLLHRFNQVIDQLQKNQKGIKDRFYARDTTHEFLGPILSGKILRDFDDEKGFINMDTYCLEDNFKGGHSEYFKKWRHLFLFEAYSFLMNSRWSKFSSTELDLKNSILMRQQEKSMCWRGYFQFNKQEGKLCSLRMLKEPPVQQHKDKNYSKIYDDPERLEGAKFELCHCREDDLIVISKFRVNLEGGEDIKMVSGGSKFLRELLGTKGVIFGFVKKAAGKLDNHVEILVDGKYENLFTLKDNEPLSTVHMRYCYHFESLLTALREFKALKQIEFTRLCPIVFLPTLSLDYKEHMLKQYCQVIVDSFAKYDIAPELLPKNLPEEEEKAQSKMNNYLIQNHDNFNSSQSEVLEKIIEMPRDEVMLIQGPPGTGKTHTIIGIISMLMCATGRSNKQKIMVCAPSNAAIDQIIIRIVERGLIGLNGLKKIKDRDRITKSKKRKNSVKDLDAEETSDDELYEPPDLTTALVRVSSAEYQTDTDIKKHTLEQRIIKKLCIEKFGSLKKCIKDLKEMIKQLNDFDAWDDYQEFPFVNKQLFKNYTKCMKDSYIKHVEGWADPNLSRAQQTKMMEHQLKMHEKELQEFKTGQNVYQGNQEWKDAEKLIIEECNIVCCTLAMAGSAKLDSFVNQFEYLIVDEACQSTEMQTLIPLRLAPKRVILVGDQQQLPATTFSNNSEETGYCRSLFERLLDSGFDKTMLTIQYRMHPKIRAFPSEQFYDGEISDHDSIGFRTSPVTISNLVRLFTSRMIFFDIMSSEEIYDNKSKCNIDEADFTKILVDYIARKMSLQGTLKYIKGQIGVISPYKAQVRQLHQRLEQLCSDQACTIQDTIEVNTVDAFQGSEKDIIIFNCVRSNCEGYLEKSLGFLLDERRLNVAITRPKFFLMIIGNAKTLAKSTVWGNLISYCQDQGQIINVPDKSYFDTMQEFKRNIVPQFMGDY